ncbi:MAG TPA: amidohydrolase family protein [Candidatus Limnocylindria bacterium]|nr:amidohydrolase family protein [Candidatus Limnocylindria bacterium]
MGHTPRDTHAQLMDHIGRRAAFNTHSHHLPDSAFRDFTLDTLLRRSYVDWCGVTFDETEASRAAYLDKVRFKSYFVWLQKSLQELYDFREPLTARNWDEVSARIASAHRDPAHHLRVLKETCGYAGVVLDTYWDPGSDNGHPERFSPTFRVDPLFFAYSPDGKDHDGNSPHALYGDCPRDLDGFLAWVRALVMRKKEQGCVALKCALAYDRGLGFRSVPKDKAARALRAGTASAAEEIADFQDYLFHHVCALAAEFSLPLQCHTGLGQLTDTRAIHLKDAIQRHPKTAFVLFHCGYPWTDDVLALLHNYPNVYPDLCWLPLLSPSAAQRTLHGLIEVGTADKVCWGCDTWTSEESFGALLAFRHVLANVLADKVDAGYFSLPDALEVAGNIMANNAAALYRLRG